jgi:hypothetical protein
VYTKAHIVYKTKDNYSKHEEDIDLGGDGRIFYSYENHYSGCFKLENHKLKIDTFIPFDSVEKIEAFQK